MIPKLSAAPPSGKLSGRGTGDANSTAKGRAPLQGRKTRGFPSRRTASWHLPALRTAQPAVGPQHRSTACLPSRPGPSPGLCKQLCSPLPPRPEQNSPCHWAGLFGNNGGNIKQGLKTGSESLGSQRGSPGRGRAVAAGGAAVGWGHLGAWRRLSGKGSRMFPSCPTIGRPPALPGFLHQARSSS